MYIFYILLSILIYPLCLVALIALSIIPKHNKIYQKFLPFKRHKKADIHFHFASYGEARSLRDLINYYKDQGKTVLLTCSSKTGLKEAKNIDDNAFLLPYEPLLYLWLNPADVLIVYEAELWLGLFSIYKKYGKKTILLNARMKKNSFKKYYKLRFFYNLIFSKIDYVLAQSDKDYKRLEKLGAKNIEVFTNIKLTNKIEPSKKLDKNKEIVLIASTHDKEEEIILNKINMDFLKDKTLIIAPRHPERFGEVERLLLSKNMKVSKYSENPNAYLDNDVFLLDTLGELINFYSISDYVVLGGSYVPIGGHNFVEPAKFGCKITAGKYIFSQLAVLKCLENVVISDEIDFSDIKKAKISSNFSFEKLCNILNRMINETRKSI